jgi:hypothetical protein
MSTNINEELLQNKEEIMKSIEIKTENIVISAIKSGAIQHPLTNAINKDKNNDKLEESTNFLIDVMKSGAEEFRLKVGRNMTYSEMRQMYG